MFISCCSLLSLISSVLFDRGGTLFFRTVVWISGGFVLDILVVVHSEFRIISHVTNVNSRIIDSFALGGFGFIIASYGDAISDKLAEVSSRANAVNCAFMATLWQVRSSCFPRLSVRFNQCSQTDH